MIEQHDKFMSIWPLLPNDVPRSLPIDTRTVEGASFTGRTPQRRQVEYRQALNPDRLHPPDATVSRAADAQQLKRRITLL